MIFAAVSAVAGYLAFLDDRLSSRQVSIASAAVKRNDYEAFRHDPIFGDPKRKLWLFHTPAFQSLMESVLVPTGFQDLHLPFRAMAGMVVMLYLCGMYALLYSQCRSWSVAAFVAVLSTRIVEALGGATWGIGSVESITPPGLCLAAVPLVVLAFARYSRPEVDDPFSRHWRLLLVFGVIGVMGNFHLVTAMNLTIVLLIAYVGRQRFSPRCLPIALGCGLCALVAASPFIGYYFGLRARMSQGAPEAHLRSVYEAIRIGELTVLYPGLLKGLLDWRMLAGALVLVVPAAAVLWRFERYKARDLGLWLWVAFGSLFVTFFLHGVSQSIACIMDSAPPAIDFIQASSLLVLPLYVLLAQAITTLFRLLRGHQNLVRAACAALLAAWLVPSDNLRVARHGAADLATAFMAEEDKPAYVLRHAEDRAERTELAAIARWAAARKGSIYLTDRGEFRVLARRPILAGPDDARYLYYLAPGRLKGWVARFNAQKRLLHPGTAHADAEALRQFATGLIDAGEEKAALEKLEWYVILQARHAPKEPEPLEAVEDSAWGRHYCLYRVR
jgi:hypothetical protein